MRWWIFLVCFNDIHTVASLRVCTTWFTKPRNRGWQESQEEMHLQPVQELWIKHMVPPWLPACFVLFGVQEKQGCETVCLPPDHSFWDVQVVGETQVTSYSSSLTCFSTYIECFLVFLASSLCQASMQSAVKQPSKEGESVTRSWLIKYFSIYSYTVYSTYFHFLINYSITIFI